MSEISVKVLEAKKCLDAEDYVSLRGILDEILVLDKPKKRGRKSKLDKMLETLGYTRDEMQKFWDDALEVNWKIQAIAKCGKDWKDLNEYQLKQLVGLKEKTLAQLAEKEAKKKAELEAKNKADAEKQYYLDHFEEILLKKLLAHEELTNKELVSLVFEFDIWSRYIDRLRWAMSKEVISEVSGHYFRVVFYEDSGDMGEHQFPDYPVEVSWDSATETYSEIK